jgi:hypothetical protein
MWAGQPRPSIADSHLGRRCRPCSVGTDLATSMVKDTQKTCLLMPCLWQPDHTKLLKVGLHTATTSFKLGLGPPVQGFSIGTVCGDGSQMDQAFPLALQRAAWTVTPTPTTKLRGTAPGFVDSLT